MARTIRQREDDKSKWDVLEEGPDGRPSVSVVDTVTAANMQRAGDVITSGEEWGNAYKAAEERAGVLKRGGAGTPGMVHALDENDEPVVASLDTVRQRGWEVVTPETAARAGEAFMARRQPPEVAVSNGKAAPATVQPFRRMSPEDAQTAEQDVRAFQAGLPTGAPAASRAAPARPTVDVQRTGATEPMRGFQSLAQYAPAMRPEDERQAMQAPTSALPAQAGDEEFAAAQAEARARRTAAGIGRAGAMLNQAISGAGFDAGVYDDFASNAELPVKELVARREANKRKALEDPTSDASRRLQSAVAKALPGVYSPEELALISAADEGSVMKYGEMRQRLDQRAAERTREDALRTAGLAREDTLRADERTYREKQAGADRAFQAGEAAKQRAFQRELASLNNAADLAQAQARGARGPDGQPLAGGRIPAGEAQSLGQADFALQALGDLQKAFSEKTGALSGVTQYIPGTDTVQYDDQRRAAAQMIGTYMEGGKLTEGDVPKYMALLPSPGDGKERAAAKVETIKRLIGQRRTAQIRGLHDAGFDTSRFNTSTSAAPSRTVDSRFRMPDGSTVVLYSDGSEELLR